jgi:predicted dehydrogenase/nucleoside-diphosphate-sugar epimerase
MPNRPLDLAIVGCGAITEHAHLPAAAALPGLRVTALVDARRDRAAALARRWGVPQAAGDADEIQERPDAVLIALPHHLHAPVSLGFLRQGVHVLVEKPMALTVADCDAMIRAAGAARVQLAVGLVRRFLPVGRLVKAVLATGVLGPLTVFDVREGRVFDWPATSDSLLRRAAAGGGVLVDTGVHVLDTLLDWLGDLEVVECRDDRYGGVEADAELHLVTAGGAPGVVELSRTRALRNTFQIQGEVATLEASFETGDVTLRRGAQVIAIDQSAELPCLAGTAVGKDVFRVQLADWIDAIRDHRPPAVPGCEGRRSVAVLEACAARRQPLVLPWMTVELAATVAVAGRRQEDTALRGRQVLVTGGTGFIGGRLVEKLVLEHGARVRVLVRNYARACRVARFDVELAAADVTDAAAVARAADGCDVVFHCAYGNRGTPAEQRAVNVGGTAAVVDAALAAGVRRLVHVSTIAVYGPIADGDLDETTQYGPPGDLYAATKAEAERLVLEAHRRRGLSVTVVQPTVVYGPFGPVFTIDPLVQLASRRVVLVDGGQGLCNAVYVDDAADALVLAATRAAADGEVFLVSGAAPVTWRRFYDAYERMLGVAATFAMPASELRALAAEREEDEAAGCVLVERLRERGVAATLAAERGPFRVPGLPSVHFFAARTRVRIDKAARLLGYEPRFDLERGMRLTAAWARWAGLVR